MDNTPHRQARLFVDKSVDCSFIVTNSTLGEFLHFASRLKRPCMNKWISLAQNMLHTTGNLIQKVITASVFGALNQHT